MSLGFSTLVAIVAVAVSLLWIKDLRLPYPCFKVAQTISPEHVAAPSDLGGPYSVNTHLQKARKLFEHEIDSVGRRLSFEACMQSVGRATGRSYAQMHAHTTLDVSIYCLIMQRQ